jgi:hypothetical protein
MVIEICLEADRCIADLPVELRDRDSDNATGPARCSLPARDDVPVGFDRNRELGSRECRCGHSDCSRTSGNRFAGLASGGCVVYGRQEVLRPNISPGHHERSLVQRQGDCDQHQDDANQHDKPYSSHCPPPTRAPRLDYDCRDLVTTSSVGPHHRHSDIRPAEAGNQPPRPPCSGHADRKSSTPSPGHANDN